MRPAATLVVSLAMALGAIGLAVAAPGGEGDLARAELQAASGAVRIANSHAARALFDVTAMRPGATVTGEVTIGNDGDVAGRFDVQAVDVVDSGPQDAGKLSERLELVLSDVTNGQNRLVFKGAPAALDAIGLGEIAAGQERDYRFVASLPSRADDNRFQGTALSLGFEWRASTVAGDASPTPTPTTPTTPSTPTTPTTPTTPSTPTTPTAPTAPSTPPVAVADAIGLPAATSCVRSSRLTLRLKAPAGGRLTSATVKVNGRVKARLKGAKAARPIALRGLKKKTKLAVSVKAADGRTYSAARTYKACRR